MHRCNLRVAKEQETSSRPFSFLLTRLLVLSHMDLLGNPGMSPPGNQDRKSREVVRAGSSVPDSFDTMVNGTQLRGKAH